jgi:hypothetical protein
MAGLASRDEVKADLLRLLESFGEQLQLVKGVLEDLPGSSTGQARTQGRYGL